MSDEELEREGLFRTEQTAYIVIYYRNPSSPNLFSYLLPFSDPLYAFKSIPSLTFFSSYICLYISLSPLFFLTLFLILFFCLYFSSHDSSETLGLLPLLLFKCISHKRHDHPNLPSFLISFFLRSIELFSYSHKNSFKFNVHRAILFSS